MTIVAKQELEHYEFEKKRKDLLDYYKKKQEFKVSIGKSEWECYQTFNPLYNLREILKDEIVIEFDTDNQALADKAAHSTAINLSNKNIEFEVWGHGGRSVHIHIHNLPISSLNNKERNTFKKIFIQNVVDKEFLPFVDKSLTGIHLIRLEWSPCWKGKYGIKKLLHVFSNCDEEFNEKD